MKYRLAFLAGLLVCGCLISTGIFGADKDDGPKEITFQYVADWSILKNIPSPCLEPPEIMDDYLPLPNPHHSKGFRAFTDNAVLKVDSDGDTKADKDIKKKEELVTFDIVYEGGVKGKYQMRFWQNGVNYMGAQKVPRWCYQRGGFMKGQAEGEVILLIDDNNNGFYNDYGEDAIVIGQNSKGAGRLSRFINLKDSMYEITIDTTGTKAQLKKCAEKLGRINIEKELNFPKMKPVVLTLKSGDKYINIFPGRKTNFLPVGEYEFDQAIFDQRLRARAGAFPKITIEEGKETMMKWGGPFKLLLKPSLEKSGQLVIFIPPAEYKPPALNTKIVECPFIKMSLPTAVVGAQGEEYFGSPEFKDEKGFCLPDATIDLFMVAIAAKEPAQGVKTAKGKLLNKIGNQFVDNWVKIDMSGLVEKKPPYWDGYYQCPLYDYKGKIGIKVSTKSNIFGELVFEQEMEIQQ
ncbi:MAG: hypothetical protein HY811_00545 [Planctomycetes bacterium]|nr:hypothetical protein [Planctomycetota bacterium]